MYYQIKPKYTIRVSNTLMLLINLRVSLSELISWCASYASLGRQPTTRMVKRICSVRGILFAATLVHISTAFIVVGRPTRRVGLIWPPSSSSSDEEAPDVTGGASDPALDGAAVAAKRARQLAASKRAADEYDRGRRRNVLIAVGSALAGAGSWAWERLGSGEAPDAAAIATLRRMEAESVRARRYWPAF